MTMETATTKPFYRSTTLQGVMVSIIGMLLMRFGVTGVEDEVISMFIATVFELVGIVVTVYGRVHSDKKLTA